MATPTQLNMITNLIRTNMHQHNDLETFLSYCASMVAARESGDHDQLKLDTQSELNNA
ncbi:hypothetical protein VPHK394_0041 [Vibrio phage K394]